MNKSADLVEPTEANKNRDMEIVAENSTFKAVKTSTEIQIIRKALDKDAIAPDGTRAWEEEDFTNPLFADFFEDSVWRTLPLDEEDDAQWMMDEEVASVI